MDIDMLDDHKSQLEVRARLFPSLLNVFSKLWRLIDLTKVLGYFVQLLSWNLGCGSSLWESIPVFAFFFSVYCLLFWVEYTAQLSIGHPFSCSYILSLWNIIWCFSSWHSCFFKSSIQLLHRVFTVLMELNNSIILFRLFFFF